MKKEFTNKTGQRLSFENKNGVLSVSLSDGERVSVFDVPQNQCADFHNDFAAVAKDAINAPLSEEEIKAISARYGDTTNGKQPF